MAIFDARVGQLESAQNVTCLTHENEKSAKVSKSYVAGKRAMDIVAVLVLSPVALLAALVLLVLNPIYNNGSLLYKQTRMGQRGRPFTAYKFRSMAEANPVKRGAFDSLEESRITKLGAVIRRLRIDELPQLINILKGDMSLVGPRPDFIDHANVYANEIPGYRARYSVKPGVTGLAQIEVGYVSDEIGFRRKVAADLEYIRTMSFTGDLKLILRTVAVVLARHGR